MCTRLSILLIAPVFSPTDMTICHRVSRMQHHKMKRYMDARRGACTPRFQVGDRVHVWNPHDSNGHRKFTDPLTVAKRQGMGTYILSNGKTWNATHLTAFPCGSESTEAAHDAQTTDTRPKRGVQKPSWLNDYVT